MPANQKKWYALLDGNSVVIQKQPYFQDGFVEIPENVVAGYILQNGQFVPPELTPKEPPSEDLLETASVFKAIMEIHFGSGAVMDKTITEKKVTKRLIDRRLTGTGDPNDASDAMILKEGFEAIKTYTEDGTVWSFPWDLVPQLS